MTHRSRSGGPQRSRNDKGKKKGPKLHHPPPRAAATVDEEPDSEAEADAGRSDAEEDDAVPPPAAFTSSPDEEQVLKVLYHALRPHITSRTFLDDVQRVKGLLYDRKWIELFTDPNLLDAYAGRWVPSRALCFRDMFASVRDVRSLLVGDGAATEENEDDVGLENGAESDNDDNETNGTDNQQAEGEAVNGNGSFSNGHSSKQPPKTILAIGGGAGSELLAVAALAASSLTINRNAPDLHWIGADIGQWGGVLDRIENSSRDRWSLPSGVTFDFVEGDILKPVKTQPAAAGVAPTPVTQNGAAQNGNGAANGTNGTQNGHEKTNGTNGVKVATPLNHPALAPPAALAPLPSPDLTTILFTLTELLSQNRARTVALLRHLTETTAPGGLLLVADSASDIAEFPLGKDGRTWPVYMVLDALMLGPAGSVTKDGKTVKGWEKIRSDDSRWYRVPADVGRWWPCKLENVRYWIRVYRRL